MVTAEQFSAAAPPPPPIRVTLPAMEAEWTTTPWAPYPVRLPLIRSYEIAGGFEHEMFGEQPKRRTAPDPTLTLPPTTTVAGTAGALAGSPGVTASSRAPGAMSRSPLMVILPAGM